MPYYPLTIPILAGFSGATCEVDFGHADGGESNTSNTVTVAASWIEEDSILTCSATTFSSAGSGYSSIDHDPEDALLEGISVQISNIIPGVGFDVTAIAPNNNSWGRYSISIAGQ